MKYKLVKATCDITLAEKINMYLEDGWILWGSPNSINNNTYIQAMIKEYK